MKCEKCSPPEARRPNAPPLSSPAGVRQLPVAVASDPPIRAGLVEATQAALDGAERSGTPLGAIALQLAETLTEGGHTASGMAALAKELRAALAAALDGAPTAPDLVDELRERRDRRRGA